MPWFRALYCGGQIVKNKFLRAGKVAFYADFTTQTIILASFPRVSKQKPHIATNVIFTVGKLWLIKT